MLFYSRAGSVGSLPWSHTSDTMMKMTVLRLAAKRACLVSALAACACMLSSCTTCGNILQYLIGLPFNILQAVLP